MKAGVTKHFFLIRKWDLNPQIPIRSYSYSGMVVFAMGKKKAIKNIHSPIHIGLTTPAYANSAISVQFIQKIWSRIPGSNQ